MDPNQVEYGGLQGIFLRDIPTIGDENTIFIEGIYTLPGQRNICSPNILLYQRSQVDGVDIVREVVLVYL